ncbi:cytochrome P450 [Pseudonocardia spinosispora]|uniref:cytochrome P450 n=1 Tax=Pseudonocardia spinosispora TaxID=103441 RepID=UPI0004149FC8|nr:cytochrome P450 [Pseudonocardia spinosispora]
MTTTGFEGQGTGLTQHSSGNPDRPYDEVNLSTTAFWSTTMDDREESFAVLRRERPITWQPPFEDQLMPVDDDYGYWAITTHRHLAEVTKRPQDFLSGPGIVMDNLPTEFLEAAQSIIAMDPPRHTKLRRLMSAAFTPKQMRRIEDQIKANATKVVDNLIEKAHASEDGWVDFVEECGALLPMHNFNDMMGVPDGVRQKTSHEMSVMMSWGDDEITGSTKEEKFAAIFNALTFMHELSKETVVERRSNPTGDLFTSLAQAEVDGEMLTDHEIGSFFVLLTVAGNDTTRQSLAHGVRALTTNPEQRAWLLEDLEGRMQTSVEELVRWATPIMTFRRTAAHDTELDGVQISAGDKLVMFYSSANRDEDAIDHAHELDLSRNPNPHISFGGGGIHHCLGNQLARFQIKALFIELLTRCPDIVAGEPELSPGNFFHVVKRMACKIA